MNIAMRTVELSRRGEYLKFDVASGWVRMTHYQPKIEKIDGKFKQTGEVRTAIKKRNLRDALLTVLGEADSKQDPLTVEAYIRATPWGKDLP